MDERFCLELTQSTMTVCFLLIYAVEIFLLTYLPIYVTRLQ